MMMQHRRGTFFQFKGEEVEVRDFALLKMGNADRDEQIRITQISEASKRIADEYPDLAAWFCLTVPPYREFAVEDALKNEGVDAYVATYLKEEIRRRGRVGEAKAMPVLPGYVLVRCVPSPSAMSGLRRFRCLKRKSIKVTGIVGSELKPYVVPMKYMKEFIEKAANGAYDERPPGPEEFAPGELVRVVDGPFAMFEAVVVDHDIEQNRIRVEVSIFGRETPLDLDVAQIEKV